MTATKPKWVRRTEKGHEKDWVLRLNGHTAEVVWCAPARKWRVLVDGREWWTMRGRRVNAAKRKATAIILSVTGMQT